MVPNLPRPIAKKLLDQQNVPVLILEGARAVGKTTSMINQVQRAGYSYTTLADRSTFAAASLDVESWVRQLRRPAIIDEAQLLPSLPLALKELVDKLGPENHFVLTGSASIGRDGLGGADPLARRSLRLTMNPLTSWEVNQQPGSIVDALFDGTPVVGTLPTKSDAELLAEMQIGGFPSYRFAQPSMTRTQVDQRIRSDVLSLLSEPLLPGEELDSMIGRSALDGLLRMPGAIFNASKLAQTLDLDRRTIDRYLGIFTRRFLLHWLPNLATGPSRQTHARAKVHPVDVSFSVESLLRARVDPLVEREKFGQLLESYVVNQIVTAAEWSTVDVDCYYWRDSTVKATPEVDLVVVTANNESIGIEVKAARSVDPRDFSGLRALRSDRGLDRGYLFYMGNELREYPNDMWAIPISALGSAAAFSGSWNAKDPEGDRPMTSNIKSFDATLFLSYVHADDEQAGGRIVQFARDLIKTYEFLYGHDLELFIDREDILWGENWRQRLTSEVETTSFLLSIVTPRYLKSEACRAEVLGFASAAKEASEPRLLLPLQWVDISQTDVVAENDPVRQQLEQSQYIDVSSLRRIPPGSVEYTDVLEKVASRLRQTIQGRGSIARSQASSADDNAPDLMETMQELVDRQGELEDAVNRFKSAFGEMGAVFEGSPSPRASGTYASANAFAQLGHRLEKPLSLVDSATNELGDVWQHYDSGLARVSRILAESPESEARESMFELLDGLARSLELPGSDLMEQQLILMGNVSKHLKPMSRTVSAAIQLLKGIQESARSWRDRF